jgi:hypothetical protein
MHGCSSKQIGGAVTEVPMPHNAAMLGGKDNIINGAVAHQQVANFLKVQGINPPLEYNQQTRIAYSRPQIGGYKSKHRRRHYKKSIGRKGRSRRFRGSRK